MWLRYDFGYQHVSIMLDIASRETYVLMREFQPYYEKLKKWLKLSVSYYSHQCPGCYVGDCYQGDKSYCQTDSIYL
jgi:hypothetical protein